METVTSNHAVIGIDLGGTKALGGVFDSAGKLLHSDRIEVAQLTTEALIDALVALVDRLRSSTELPIAAAGYGVPTTIDQRTGMAVVAANLPIQDVPLRDLLDQRTGLTTYIDNDANVAALAEAHSGAGADLVNPHLIMVTLGTGFGGGIVIGGRIARGAIGAGAELGHMSISSDGLPCVAPNCPGIGCIETYVGGGALARDIATHIDKHPSSCLAQAVADGQPAQGETVVSLARNGDEQSLKMIETMAQHLGEGLANFVNIFNPEVICVGGGMTPALDLLLPIAQRVVIERALPPGNTFVSVVPAVHGPEAGMIGAAQLAATEHVAGTLNGSQ